MTGDPLGAQVDAPAAAQVTAPVELRPRSVARTIGIAILATLAVALWVYATSVHVITPLGLRGRLPSALDVLVDRDPGISVLRLLAGLTATILTMALAALLVRTTWRRLVAVVAVPVAAVGLFFAAGHLVGARVDFAVYRDAYDEIAQLADAGKLVPGDPYGHTPLPARLQHTSALGYAIVRNGMLFIPLWTSIPDDAGGLLYSPDRSPDGFDMLGMQCEDPVPLEDGWWSCGMRY